MQAGGFFGFSGMGFLGPNGPGHGIFEETFRCYSMIFFETSKAEEDYGGKSECGGMWCGPSCINHSNLFTVILPSSALERLGKCVYIIFLFIPWVTSVVLYVHYTLSFLSLPSCSLFCPLPPSLPFAFPLIISPSQYQLPYVVSSQQYVINWCQMLHPLWRAGVQCWRGKSICATMGRWSFIDQP